jgi:HEAT repeat protein
MESKPERKGLIARLEKDWILESEFAEIAEDTDTIDSLLDALHDSNPTRQAEAAGILIDKGAAAVGPLILELRSENHSVWMLAAAALVKISYPAVPALLNVLEVKRESESVQMLVVEVLGQIGHEAAIKPLIATLESESSPLRTAAAIALVRIRSGVTTPLLAVLSEAKSPSFRQDAIAILRQIGEPEALNTLEAWQAIDDLLD